MAELNGFIKIERSILRWRWFKDRNTLTVWLWILASANFKPNYFENEIIQPGEVATSLNSISISTNLTVNMVRTALKHLKSTGEITTRNMSHYQVITVVNWDKYQNVTSKSTGKSQANHIQITGRSQQRKNDKNAKNEKKERSVCTPTLSEVRAFVADEGLTMDAERFFNHYESVGWKYNGQRIENWQARAKLWASDDAEKKKPKANDDDGLDVWGKPIKKEFE